jgi:superoxide dismutase, Cu-Zn family
MNSSLRMLTVSSVALVAATGLVMAQQLAVDINKVSDAGVGEKIGSVTISEGKNGTTFKVAVTSLPTGKHGFHLHDKGDCAAAMKDGKMQAAGAAGGHYDPDNTKTHKGPKGAGHKGDLPVLTANAKGINQSVTAPKLKLADVQGRALVIHEGGDNYSDNPENGGGKGRIACGVIPKS